MIIDKCRGAFMGLAIGDALGAAVEFQSPGSFIPVTGYRSGGPHGLAAGEWTDDTSMALALADSINNAGWDLHDQLRRYVDWWKNGRYSVNGHCFDIGTTVRRALDRYLEIGDPLQSGDSSERASGNGSIMRLAPVPIRYGLIYPHELSTLSDIAAESSVPTHPSSQCVSACRVLTIMLAALMQGSDRSEVLSSDWPMLRALNDLQPLDPAILRVASGSYRENKPPTIRGTGWVVQSLEAALWAFHGADSFQDAVLAAVNLGEDADTTGAICGQLAGAYWGESNIPAALRNGLAQRSVLENALQKLLETSGLC